MHKKTIILIISIILSIILLSILTFCLIQKSNLSNKCIDDYIEFFQNNDEKIFSIDRITYFSNCSANIDTNYNSSFKISNLNQYTDIAIFLNNNSTEYTAANTLKSVTLSDINFSLLPEKGIPNLYYKNINDFAKSNFNTENLIKDNITFETTSENDIDYSKPILYNNCANPITLCYVNSNIKKDYTLSENISNITHNGALLKSCGITLNSISCQISMVINITNNLDENFTCPITLTIPLSTENSTIYDGCLKFKDSTNYNFIKEK